MLRYSVGVHEILLPLIPQQRNAVSKRFSLTVKQFATNPRAGEIPGLIDWWGVGKAKVFSATALVFRRLAAGGAQCCAVQCCAVLCTGVQCSAQCSAIVVHSVLLCCVG